MKLLKQIIPSAFIGMGIGTLVNFMFVLVTGRDFSFGLPAFIDQFPSETVAAGLQLIIFAVLGISQGLAGNLFTIAHYKQNLLVISILHYLLIIFPLLSAAWYLRWFSASWLAFLALLLSVSFTYLLIYTFNYLMIKRDILSINQKLKEHGEEE
ncbi:DUF3021 domain-containing protein [Streptococcus chenjunshii]|uniref:DUF3021 domain-containing protein n=1 Tax=Streptococcus chenjunshii TaxID=2173853 RepID=A0A372KMJ0_9STRE|nr:DUF3021 domain-containing protein [Streptococcus chenjunshii]AXQ79602.1 DUF3021 domain-containing protein [Streptococcus chenjunshii]RFU51517.1 DUF3021 domain-containing protein [Streptococcus chenjunshii]RFU53502.1 DUF3021 domain-containing protein [Streptococcus chenjunshii]